MYETIDTFCLNQEEEKSFCLLIGIRYYSCLVIYQSDQFKTVFFLHLRLFLTSSSFCKVKTKKFAFEIELLMIKHFSQFSILSREPEVKY